MTPNSKWTIIRTTDYNRLHKAELALQRVLAVDDTGPVVVTAIGNFAPIDRAVPYVREWLDASKHTGMERQSDPAVKVVNL